LGILGLAGTMLSHGQERLDSRSTGVALLEGRQGLRVLAGAVLSHAQGGLILALRGSPLARRLRLAEGKVILDAIEVRLTEEGPTGLVIALRIGLFLIAAQQRPGLLPGLGADGPRGVQIVEDVGLTQGLGE